MRKARTVEVFASVRSTTLRAQAVAAVLCAAALLTGCRGEADPASADGPSVVAPGKPGEPARTLSPEEAQKQAADGAPNSADRAYVTDMIVHHRQALTMTDLAGKHAVDGPVRRLAERIAGAQGPEIKAMRGWQATRGEGRSGRAGGHDHSTMPGMASEEDLEKLGEARGADFDEMFLRLMIAHHQGAVEMATAALSEGNDTQVEEMANDVVATQTAEIGRMRKLL